MLYQVRTKVSFEKRVNLHHFELDQIVVADELGQFAVVRSFAVCRIKALHLLGDKLELFRIIPDHRYVEQAESVDTGGSQI